MLAAAYDLLAECPPFTRWNMPPSEDVRFLVNRDRKNYGRCAIAAGKPPEICLSSRTVSTMDTLMATMAHEMIHLHMDTSGMKDRGDHGPAFVKMAARAIVELGFNPDTF